MPEVELYRLSICADPLGDGLVRILNLVALQPVTLKSVRHNQGAGGAMTVIEITAAQPARAERLEARLRQAAWARDVRLLALAPAAPG